MENKKEPLMSVKEWFSENTDKIPTAEERILITKYANYVTQWQQQQNKNLYSEEEVLRLVDNLFHKYSSDFRVSAKIDAKEWFEQNKKK